MFVSDYIGLVDRITSNRVVSVLSGFGRYYIGFIANYSGLGRCYIGLYRVIAGLQTIRKFIRFGPWAIDWNLLDYYIHARRGVDLQFCRF